MSKLAKFGLICLFAGALSLGYQGISAIKGTDGTASNLAWVNISFGDILGENLADWANDSRSSDFGNMVAYMVFAPVYIGMFVVAGICFVIDAFRGR